MAQIFFDKQFVHLVDLEKRNGAKGVYIVYGPGVVPLGQSPRRK